MALLSYKYKNEDKFFHTIEDTDPTVKNLRASSDVVFDNPTAQKSNPIGMLSSNSGVSQINQQKSYMDQTYPFIPAPTNTQSEMKNQEAKNPETKTESKAYFVNQSGQEAEYSQEQLNSPEVQQFLKNNGYVLTKSNGLSVGSDFTTSDLKNDVNRATEQVESLERDFMSYRVDEDPAFISQANSIKADFDKLKREAEKVNQQRQRAYETLGFRTGTTQYADAIGSGIVGEEIRQGSERIADITRQESASIVAAREAFKTRKFSEYNMFVNSLKDLRAMKMGELENYNRVIADATKRLQAESNAELDNLYKKIQIQKAQQEIVQSNLDAYSSGFVDFDEEGNVITADEREIRQFSAESGIPYEQIIGSIRQKANDLSKLSLDERKKELDILNAQRQLIPQEFQEFEYVVENQGFKGDFFDFLKEKKRAIEKEETPSVPNSYREWEMAGKPGTFSEWLGKVGETGDYSQKQLNALSKINDKVVSNDAYKKTSSMRGYVDAVISALSAQNGVSDIAAINQFQKVIDDGAVTRDQDVKLIQGAQSLSNSFQTRIKKLQSGEQLSSEQRTQMRQLVENIYQAQVKALNKDPGVQAKKREAELNGINIEDTVLGELGAFGQASKNGFYRDYSDFSKKATPQERQKMLDLIEANPDIQDPNDIFSIYMEDQGFSGAGSDASSAQIGSLSEKFESGGNPGAIGYDRTGGLSYGTYQLAHNNAKSFVEQSPYANEFRNIQFNSKQWQNKWKEIAQRDPQGFEQAQKSYIEQTHFDPQIKKLQQSGINLDRFSNVLKDVIWSTAVQHGANNNIVLNAIKAVGKNAPEESIIKKIYELRWGRGKQFSRSTEAVKKSVYQRFFGKNGELNLALSKLKNNV